MLGCIFYEIFVHIFALIWTVMAPVNSMEAGSIGWNMNAQITERLGTVLSKMQDVSARLKLWKVI